MENPSTYNMKGKGLDGRDQEVVWNLYAEDGPKLPSTPSAILATKLASGELRYVIPRFALLMVEARKEL